MERQYQIKHTTILGPVANGKNETKKSSSLYLLIISNFTYAIEAGDTLQPNGFFFNSFNVAQKCGENSVAQTEKNSEDNLLLELIFGKMVEIDSFELWFDA